MDLATARKILSDYEEAQRIVLQDKQEHCIHDPEERTIPCPDKNKGCFMHHSAIFCRLCDLQMQRPVRDTILDNIPMNTIVIMGQPSPPIFFQAPPPTISLAELVAPTKN